MRKSPEDVLFGPAGLHVLHARPARISEDLPALQLSVPLSSDRTASSASDLLLALPPGSETLSHVAGVFRVHQEVRLGWSA